MQTMIAVLHHHRARCVGGKARMWRQCLHIVLNVMLAQQRVHGRRDSHEPTLLNISEINYELL
jgi:hypothetical protein